MERGRTVRENRLGLRLSGPRRERSAAVRRRRSNGERADFHCPRRGPPLFLTYVSISFDFGRPRPAGRGKLTLPNGKRREARRETCAPVATHINCSPPGQVCGTSTEHQALACHAAWRNRRNQLRFLGNQNEEFVFVGVCGWEASGRRSPGSSAPDFRTCKHAWSIRWIWKHGLKKVRPSAKSLGVVTEKPSR